MKIQTKNKKPAKAHMLAQQASGIPNVGDMLDAPLKFNVML